VKRIVLARAFMGALLLLATFLAPSASIANADADIAVEMPAVKVISPLWKSVFNSPEVLLSFEVTRPQSWAEVFPGYTGGVLYYSVGVIKSVRYSLDGKVSENVTVEDNAYALTIGPSSRVFDFSFNLTGLFDGPHNVTVNVFGSYKGEAFNFSGSPIIFFVDTAPLELEGLSPESRMYSITDISLTVASSEPVSWIGYSLDEGDRVTIAENATLKELPAGSHNLTVFANDTIGNFASSETITFTVAETEPTAPFPLAPVVTASVASIATIGVALLLYFKKHRH